MRWSFGSTKYALDIHDTSDLFDIRLSSAMAFTLLLTKFTLVSGRGISASRARLISLTSPRHGKLVAYKLADIGEGIREVTVKEWFVKPGDKVSQFDNICEVQSDKASVMISSRYDGIVQKLYYQIDQNCLVGNALVDIELETDHDPTENETETGKIIQNQLTKSEDIGKILTTPAVRKIAKENEIDLMKIQATGKHGRILKEDLLVYLEQSKITKSKEEPPNVQVRHRSFKRKYAKEMWNSMTQSLTIPHSVYGDEYDISKLVNIRTEMKEAFAKESLHLTYMPFFIKATSQALRAFPELNAWVDEENKTFEIKEQHNIMVAMDSPNGLIIPNVKNVQNLNILEIVKELNRLQELGKNCSLTPTDIAAGTFGLSNIGIVGGTYLKPVISWPQVTIGAIGKIQNLPRFDKENNVVSASILTVSWSTDHRVVDGVTIAKFSELWRQYVENPLLLLAGL